MDFICMVVDTIAGWWKLIGDNAGQIQIVIGIVAILYAFKQIRNSREQRAFTLKEKIISSLFNSIGQNNKNTLEYNQYIKEVEKEVIELRKYNNKNINDALDKLEKNIKNEQNEQNERNEQNQNILNKIREFKESKELNIKDISKLEDAWRATIDLTLADIDQEKKLRMIESNLIN